MKTNRISLLAVLMLTVSGLWAVPDGFYDATAHGADPTGVSDSTAALQAAINHCRDNQLALWLPGGRYTVSARLEVDQPDDDGDYPLVLVGSTVDPDNRATIVLAPNAAGFGDPDNRRAVLHYFNLGTADDEGGNTNLYNQAIIGVDFEIGAGNAGAVALRMQGAEGCTIQDVHIDLTGGGHTGIWGIPASGGATHGVSVTGGRIGIDTRKPSLDGGGSQPQPVVTGSTFVGQSDYAVYATSRGSLVLVGCVIERSGPGAAIALMRHWQGQPFDASVQLVDCVVRFTEANPGNYLIEHTGSKDRSFVLDNTYLHRVTEINAGGLSANANGWQYYRHLAVQNLPSSRSWGQPAEPPMLDGSTVTSPYVVTTANQAPPIDLQSRHQWPDDFPTWETPGVVNVKTLGVVGDGSTDDWAALQAAINSHEILFFPKGVYRVSAPLDLRADSKLIGIHHSQSAIFALSTLANRFGGATEAGGDLPILRTADTANAETFLAFLHVRRKFPLDAHDPTPPGNYAIEWRCAGKSLTRLVKIEAHADDYIRPDLVAQHHYGLDPDTIDENHPQQSFGPGQYAWSNAEPTVQVRGNGGGRWFSMWLHGRHAMREDTPILRVEGTTQPLHFYHLHLQQQDSQNHAEFINTENVTVYGTKGEIKGTMVYVENSHNFRLFGHSGMSSPDVDYFPPHLFRFVECDNFQISGIGDTINEGDTARWTGTAYDRWVHSPVTSFHAIQDFKTGRTEVQTAPGVRPILYLRGQTEPLSPIQIDPIAVIQHPPNGLQVEQGVALELLGQAIDANGDDVAASGQWASSLDGPLGTGAELTVNTLSLGDHVISFTVELPGLTLSDSVTIHIIPAEAPTITADPASAVVSRGDATTLSVSASGSGLTYQWFEGLSGNTDSPVSGATAASFTTPSLYATTAFWVRVSNYGGSADSATATVTVNDPPQLTITAPLPGARVGIGQSLTLSATATDTEDGDISVATVWTSDLDGEIGIGASLERSYLSVGIHMITASVTDSGGRTASATTTLEVRPLALFYQAFQGEADPSAYTGSDPHLFDYIGTVTDPTKNRATLSVEDGRFRNTIAYTDDGNTTQLSAARLTRLTNLPFESNFAIIEFSARLAPAAWPASDTGYVGFTIGQSFRSGPYSPTTGTDNGPAFATLTIQARGGAEADTFRTTGAGGNSTNFTVTPTDGVYAFDVVIAANAGSDAQTFPSPTGSHTLQPGSVSVWINGALHIDNTTENLTAANLEDFSFSTGSGSAIGYASGAPYNGFYEIDDIFLATLSGFDHFLVWAAGYGLSGSDALYTADPENDGIQNLHEYALGGLPTISSSSCLPTIGSTSQGSDITLSLTFHRIADPQLTYEVWASEDLLNWGSLPIWSSSATQNVEGAVTVTDSTQLQYAVPRFLRLKVTRP